MTLFLPITGTLLTLVATVTVVLLWYREGKPEGVSEAVAVLFYHLFVVSLAVCSIYLWLHLRR